MRTCIVSIVTLCVLAGCRSSGSDTAASPTDIDEQVEAWLADMSLEEKAEQMHGSAFEAELYRTAENERLGIPGFAMSDGPRGVTAGVSTTFPVAMAREPAGTQSWSSGSDGPLRWSFGPRAET